MAVSIDVWNSAVYDNDSRYVQCEQAGMPFSEGFRLVYYMAENRIENPEDIKKFDRLGYSFRSDLSSDAEYVFERKKWWLNDYFK